MYKPSTKVGGLGEWVSAADLGLILHPFTDMFITESSDDGKYMFDTWKRDGILEWSLIYDVTGAVQLKSMFGPLTAQQKSKGWFSIRCCRAQSEPEGEIRFSPWVTDDWRLARLLCGSPPSVDQRKASGGSTVEYSSGVCVDSGFLREMDAWLGGRVLSGGHTSGWRARWCLPRLRQCS